MPTNLVPRLLSSKSSDLSLGCLRVQQLTVLARWTVLLAVCSAAGCGALLVSFWDTASHSYLVALLSALLILHALAIVGSRRWLRGRAPSISGSMLVLRLAIMSAIALAWATVPLALLPIATPDQRLLLIYIGSGVISASILLAPWSIAAFLFLGISVVGVLLPMRLADGSVAWQHAAILIAYSSMVFGIILSQSREFTRRVLGEAKLKDQGEVTALLLNEFEGHASNFLWQTDGEMRLRCTSGRLAQIMKCDQSVLHGASILEWIKAGLDPSSGGEHDNAKLIACVGAGAPFRNLQVRLRFLGRECWLSMTGRPVFDAQEKFSCYRGVGSDITTARKSDERIAYLAGYDGLTDLPNRIRFQDALGEACASSAPFALLCLDLDDFKSVNDTLDHAAGDMLLIAVAGRLRSCVRECDVVARLGSDEFAVLQIGGDTATAAALAQRLIDNVARPFQIGEMQADIGLSVGIALPSDAGSTPEDLLKGADLALCHSKATGRGVWNIFESAMASRAHERHLLQIELRHAIENDELILDFQPIVDLTTGDITGAEALVRWLHQTRGRVSPADFIPIAEESGLIIPLGEWVLRRACEEAVGWTGNTRVAVNLSPLQFRDPGLLTLIDRVLAETGLPATRLELEITESVFLDARAVTVACLQALRSRGIHIALDDFGTGYSSLSYLRSFPFDKVKIDQSFIRDLGVNEEAGAIVKAIVGMTGSLGMRTTGEGVETASQARLLQLTGCSQVQGYLFGRPGPSEAIGRAVRSDLAPLSELFSSDAILRAAAEHALAETVS